MCYNVTDKGINAGHLNRTLFVVGYDFILGDKEIAVKFRSNSHYRNSA